MKSKILLLTIVLLLAFSCQKEKTLIYSSKNLIISKISANTFIHTSYLNTESYGKVPCNGMIVIDKREAIVVDSPTDSIATTELIKWLQTDLDYTIKAVIATHFHVDCLGGLQEFHEQKIPSYANNLTLQLAKASKVVSPKFGFEKKLELKFGNEKLISEFLGEGHTKDNIISYFSKDKVLFGGCLLKSEGASKGNLNDANINEWANTVEKVKEKYRNAEIIIPGHGKPANSSLLDYTIKLFK